MSAKKFSIDPHPLIATAGHGFSTVSIEFAIDTDMGQSSKVEPSAGSPMEKTLGWKKTVMA